MQGQYSHCSLSCLLMETSLQLINLNLCTIVHDNFYRKLQPSLRAFNHHYPPQ